MLERAKTVENLILKSEVEVAVGDWMLEWEAGGDDENVVEVESWSTLYLVSGHSQHSCPALGRHLVSPSCRDSRVRWQSSRRSSYICPTECSRAAQDVVFLGDHSWWLKLGIAKIIW